MGRRTSGSGLSEMGSMATGQDSSSSAGNKPGGMGKGSSPGSGCSEPENGTPTSGRQVRGLRAGNQVGVFLKQIRRGRLSSHRNQQLHEGHSWNWDSAAPQCTEFPVPAGYGFVEGRDQFAKMVKTCHDVIADTIWNDMAGFDAGAGGAGHGFTKYNYPGATSPRTSITAGTRSASGTTRPRYSGASSWVLIVWQQRRSTSLATFRTLCRVSYGGKKLYVTQEIVYGENQPITPNEYTKTALTRTPALRTAERGCSTTGGMVAFRKTVGDAGITHWSAAGQAGTGGSMPGQSVPRGVHARVPPTGRTSLFPLSSIRSIHVFVRGGSIISTRERPRRSSPLMKYDPFTLRVALNNEGAARGELYLDDGETYAHQEGKFVWREFAAEKARSKGVRISSGRAEARGLSTTARPHSPQ
ncbi:hypothetical protein C8Q76DRAFT_819052 [Earliella scabrosa]|nr:hypothetical protein C8Q76DRAFT_819052 [Earliella scabrosa]